MIFTLDIKNISTEEEAAFCEMVSPKLSKITDAISTTCKIAEKCSLTFAFVRRTEDGRSEFMLIVLLTLPNNKVKNFQHKFSCSKELSYITKELGDRMKEY